MKNYFTSDTHFAHGNIIKYCGRPFRDVAHMDAELVRRWNERVKPEDTVFHLGDFQFKNSPGGNQDEGLALANKDVYWKQLNGHIVHIRGNHDNNNARKSILTHAVVSYGGFTVGLCHDPADFQESTEYCKIDFWLVGHVHQNWRHRWVGYQFEKLQINVGVDMWRFMPITMDEILKYRTGVTKQQDTYQKRDEHNRRLAAISHKETLYEEA
jgi:calcineurin-like phosphoesterase family protein